MKTIVINSLLPQHLPGLSPIYKRIEELRKNKQEKKQKQKRKHLTMVSIDQFKMKIFQFQTLLKNRMQHQQASQQSNQNINKIQMPYSKTPSKLKSILFRNKTKSQKIMKFLNEANNKTPQKKSKLSSLIILKQNSQAMKIPPEKPIKTRQSEKYFHVSNQITSRNLGIPSRAHTESISSTTRDKTIHQLKIANNKTTSHKYLKHGHRTRQILIKQLQRTMPEQIQINKQLIYLKKYNKWFPLSLVVNKKAQLEHHLKMLIANKKSYTPNKTPTFFKPIYT